MTFYEGLMQIRRGFQQADIATGNVEITIKVDRIRHVWLAEQWLKKSFYDPRLIRASIDPDGFAELAFEYAGMKVRLVSRERDYRV